MKISKLVPEEESGGRLDVFLTELLPDVHITALRNLIKDGLVLVNGQPSAAQKELPSEAFVEVDLPDEVDLQPRKVEDDTPSPRVLYADSTCLVVEKPTGVPVNPEGQRKIDTIRDIVPGGEELRVVHRTDRGTSGCLILAKSKAAAQALEDQFTDQQVDLLCLALVRGNTPDGVYSVDTCIGPTLKRGNRMRAISHEEREKHPRRPGKEAFTEYQVRESFRGYSLVEARPKTTRTHQVRVHLASVGLPLVGDALYSHGVERGLFLSEFKPGYRFKPGREETPLLGRLALHVARICFRSPETGEKVMVESPLPRDIDRALERLRHYLGSRNHSGEGEK